MKALVIGSGGREHALAWKLSESPSIQQVYASPGNPGIATVAECLEATDYLALAQSLQVDFTVVGPEAPLVDGIVDRFRTARLQIVGPSAECARLEGSKLHSKLLMQRLDIPTARFATAETAVQAREALSRFDYPLVLKTDGLAAGKGVIVAKSPNEAHHALAQLPFPLVIEEFLDGEEISFIVLSDGKTAVPLEPSQDHKTVYDGDLGPNTGGMGAYSDSRILTSAQRDDIMDRVIQPVIHSTGYTGFLYAGLMMTSAGPKVLEFNVRLGDPETQPLMMRLDSDFGAALLAAATGELADGHLRWSSDPAACVVLASAGYPGEYKTGLPITGLGNVCDAMVFQAGTRRLADGTLVTNGGRVLGLTAIAPDLKQCVDRAYEAVNQIRFSGMHFRKDIGAKGLRRYNTEERARSSDG